MIIKKEFQSDVRDDEDDYFDNPIEAEVTSFLENDEHKKQFDTSINTLDDKRKKYFQNIEQSLIFNINLNASIIRRSDEKLDEKDLHDLKRTMEILDQKKRERYETLVSFYQLVIFWCENNNS
jgi:hypothetical protein